MMKIQFEKSANRMSLSLKCKISDSVEREFNLNRSLDEKIETTFQKLFSNYNKQFENKSKKQTKKLKKSLNDEAAFSGEAKTEEANGSSQVPDNEELQKQLGLYDEHNNQVPFHTLNQEAWKENYTFKFKDQTFKVTVDLPLVKKISLSKLLIAGLPTIAKLDVEAKFEDIRHHYSCSWYMSADLFPNEDVASNKYKMNWIKLDDSDRRMIVLNNESSDRYIRVVCTPSDGFRKGAEVEHISSSVVKPTIAVEHFPMSERHRHTANQTDSNSLRIMSYNILASCYSETALAKSELFSYCEPEYLDFAYRRILLVHEIKNYNADIIFLQECESDFLNNDLVSSFPDYNHQFKTKGEKSKEVPNATFFTKKRFINTHNISLTDELKSNPIFENVWKNICADEKLKELILNRTNILQVVQVALKGKQNKHYLLANTHLFFHPEADFVRLLQIIVCVKYLESLKNELTKNNDIQVNIVFGGDFNSDPLSHACMYLFSKSIAYDKLEEAEKEMLKDCTDQLQHSLNLTAHIDFPFTNCTEKFECILDYVFYDQDSLELTRVIPFPEIAQVKKNVAIPSQEMPSDHIALVFEFLIK